MVESFTFIEDNELNELPQDNGNDKGISEAEIDKMNMWLYLKDKFNLSNEAWREISMASDGPPLKTHEKVKPKVELKIHPRKGRRSSG